MADLKNIMNVEDDHLDSRQIKDDRPSGPRPSHDPDFSASSSRYAKVGQSPTHSYSHDPRRSSSSHALHSFATNTPSSSSPGPGSAANTSRRRSNTSTDSMDSPYGQGHPGMSSGPQMRSYPPSGPGGEHVPLKLTPITGRVSRARKGVPVHTCDLCSPPKTFTRAEHLRRHQLSHGDAGLLCPVPGCGRTFYRKDLLERHQQRHEQEGEAGGSSSLQGGSPRSPVQNYGSQPSSVTAMSPVFNMQSNYGSASGASSGMAMEHNSWPVDDRHGSGHHMRGISGDYPMGSSKDSYMQGSMSGLSASGSGIAYSQPRTVSELVGGVSQIHDGASSDSSNYSTPSSNPAHTSGSEWSTHPAYSTLPREIHPMMSSGSYTLGIPYSGPPPVFPAGYDNLGLPLAGYDDEIYSHNPHTTVRSLSPHMAVVQSSETLVTAPSALPPHRLVLPQACGRQTGEASDLLAAADGMSVSLSRAICDEIPAYLNVYWEKVYAISPIIHRPTFEETFEVAPEYFMLRCAIAAIATQFLPAKEHRIKGHQLHAYAWSKAMIFVNAEDWTLPVMQTVLLCEYYARFRGREKEAYRPSQSFGMLYQLMANNRSTFGRNASKAWKTWVDVETRRRLLAACFLLDVHSTVYYEQPGVPLSGMDYASPDTLSIPLTASTEELWEAPTSEAWSRTPRSKRPLKTVSNTPVSHLTPARIASMPAFDASILLAAHAMQLPKRRSLTKVELIQDAAAAVEARQMHIARIFVASAAANTYLALHYTPLHALLSVSGDSWVFNKKVPQASAFSGHQVQLEQWRGSGTAAAATVFATRALGAFLAPRPDESQCGSWCLSEYWGVYVCALVCWAFGHDGSLYDGGAARDETVQWVRTTAELEPKQLQGLIIPRREALGVVGLAREALERECLGGRNILLADAANVLRKLEEGGGWKWF